MSLPRIVRNTHDEKRPRIQPVKSRAIWGANSEEDYNAFCSSQLCEADMPLLAILLPVEISVTSGIFISAQIKMTDKGYKIRDSAQASYASC